MVGESVQCTESVYRPLENGVVKGQVCALNFYPFGEIKMFELGNFDVSFI